MAVERVSSRERVTRALERSGFWEVLRVDPFDRATWLAAFEDAPKMKEDHPTVLTGRDCVPELRTLLCDDEWLQGGFTGD